MEEHRRALSLEKVSRAAMTLKSSKVGTVILKDNVKEKEKLDSEIYDIDCQRRRKSEKLSRERHVVLKKHQFHKRVSASNVQESRSFLLPPVPKDQTVSLTSLRFSCEEQRTDEPSTERLSEESLQNRHEVEREVPSTKTISLSTHDSEHSLKVKQKQATSKNLSRVKRNNILPALVSPHMIRRANELDSTKDPRFAKLVSQLVPSWSTLKELDEENSNGSNSENSYVNEAKEGDYANVSVRRTHSFPERKSKQGKLLQSNRNA